MAKKTAKKTSTRKSAKKTAKKTSTRKAPKKTAKKTSTPKETAKKTSTRKSTKKAATRKTTKKASGKSEAKAPSRKPTSKKKTARKSTKKGSCGKRCSKGSCSAKALDGRSLVDRARECKNIDECRKFIVELGDAIEQSNDWLNELHDQTLSAEQARDVYGEQISDLLEAIDVDRKRIAELEAELKKARRGGSGAASSDAVLRKLATLDKEIQTIRSDLRRVLAGREPSTERRRKVERAKAPAAKPSRKALQRSAEQTVGPFAKYSVLRGAACSLGVGKHGYPPEVCAPAYFPRPVAAEILGTYAQNDYGGLAKWALMTGLPIDDGIRPPRIVEASVTQGSSTSTRKAGAGRKKAGAGRKKSGNGQAKSAGARSGSTSVPATRERKPSTTTSGGGGRSSAQVLDQVLLTIARI